MANSGEWKAIGSVAVLVLLLVWESWSPFFSFFSRRSGERARHGLRNVALGLLNVLVVGLVFVGVWWSAAAWSEARGFGLLHWLDLPAGMRLVLAFLLFDVWMYWWHRWNHRIPFLWRFHRTHHSDAAMDVTTASRFHLGEIVLSSVLRIPVIILLGVRLGELAAYELIMFAVVQFHHANIGLPGWLDRGMRMVIVTPFMHKVHHSNWQPETDSNYSSLFSWWDRLFRSFRLREDPHSLRLGLDEFRGPGDQSLAGLLLHPLKPTARVASLEDRAP